MTTDPTPVLDHYRQALADLSIRAMATSELHSAFEFGGGLIVCVHCSALKQGPVLWPCQTRQVLDGLDAP